MLARPSIIMTMMLAALPLGCGNGTEMALVDPAKYQFHDCPQLAREMKTLAERSQELRALYDKAIRGAGGELVARITYEPEYLSAIGNMRLIEAAAREKNCEPPISANSGKPPPG